MFQIGPENPFVKFILLLVLAGSLVRDAAAVAVEPFPLRGYYMTFMRMPTFGLREWKVMIDCLRDDRSNTLLLWTGGAFRSKEFPITWQYNRDHKNVERDFVRALIDYAHKQKIKVLLAFTPFAYDGVNQYPLEHPESKATQKNGQPAALWGMHSWGYNLCPSKLESQRFMLEYVREMFFRFYPNADGLMIESSDYAICHCSECREKFFDREFQFVRQISDEIWQRNPGATILVYPHYFSGRKVPGFDVTGAKQPFDPRWTLFFTPHSAHIDTNLLAEAKNSIFWSEGLTLGTPWKIRDAARTARTHGITGFVPSLEPFSCIDGPPGRGKPRQKPFHFEWLRDGRMPLNELLIRVNRIAYREFSRQPDLGEAEFKQILGREIFRVRGKRLGLSRREEKRSIGVSEYRGGDPMLKLRPAGTPAPGVAQLPRTNSLSPIAHASTVLEDLLALQEAYFFEADWFRPSPLLEPKRTKDRAQKENWPAERKNRYVQRIDRLREIEHRYRKAIVPAEREMHRIAALIVKRWDAEAGRE